MNQFRYSLFVLIGACSYGIHASIVKLTIAAGFTVGQVTGSQYLFGLAMLMAVYFFTKRVKMSWKDVSSLMTVGLLLSATGIFYGLSLARVPASIAVVMLFQFTWIGILIEAIYHRAMPSNQKLISVVFLWAGTLLAGGVGSTNFQWGEHLDGVVYGLLAAITFALFIFYSGKVAPGVPTIQRSVFITSGGLLLVLFYVSPILIVDGVLTTGLWKYGLLLGIFGTILPVVFFAIGTPKIDSGLATIVGAAELPAAIVAALFILGEAVSFLQMTGIMIILIGIAIPQIHFPTHRPKRSFSR
ncbi:drug/metabolite transporter (DMT)-like permease [Oikeobacillus pervagus]|uniref:Drug/metabolite transporter (DMT)-like permease n=1 Tax=Oikeobacillus pervagus TaxID=1325931 RepID=A0AAJ1SZ82_9BACI|nr:DMT family transporter [Oikeobacillus pervagus]MDQ0215599.1 drug/metabolite transporter (DMT)-like permease [Oikeobacillus pervagus]